MHCVQGRQELHFLKVSQKNGFSRENCVFFLKNSLHTCKFIQTFFINSVLVLFCNIIHKPPRFAFRLLPPILKFWFNIIWEEKGRDFLRKILSCYKTSMISSSEVQCVLQFFSKFFLNIFFSVSYVCPILVYIF